MSHVLVSTGSGWFLLYLYDSQTHFGLSPTSETIYYNILAVALFTHILKKREYKRDHMTPVYSSESDLQRGTKVVALY